MTQQNDEIVRQLTILLDCKPEELVKKVEQLTPSKPSSMKSGTLARLSDKMLD